MTSSPSARPKAIVGAPPPATRKGRLQWPPLFVPILAAVTITVFEMILLQRKQGIFTGGYLRPEYLKGLDIPLFIVGSLLVDAAIVAPIAWLSDAVLRRVRRLNPSQRFLLVWGLACIPLGIANFARYQMAQFLGDTIEFTLLRTLAGNDYATMLSVASSYLIGLACTLLPGLIVFGIALVVLGRRPVRLLASGVRREPTWRGCLLGTGSLLVASLGLIVATAQVRPEVFGPLNSKVSGSLLAQVADTLTDFDRDGYGLVCFPHDQAPFDARCHPYAIDIPGNGIDEDGVGGDLPARGDFSAETYSPVTFAQRPDVVIFVLESFRRDNVGARVDGQPVTPVLERLVAEGAILGDGYSHSGFTVGAWSTCSWGACRSRPKTA